MGGGGSRLEKEEAICRRGREDSASAPFTDQGIKIEVVVKAQERKLEAILSALFSMAASGVAAGFCQDRLDILLEGDRRPALRVLDLYRYSNLQLVNANKKLCSAAAKGGDPPRGIRLLFSLLIRV